MHNSTRRSRPRHHQDAKPHKDFPLTAHPSGRWCKTVKGKIIFFGKIIAGDGGASAQAALDRWLDEKDDLLAGRTPRKRREGLTIRELANRFLTYKQHLIDNAELKQRTWDEYHATCERLIKVFGKERLVADLVPDDFESLRANIAKKWGFLRLGNEMQRVRSVFKYAFESALIEKPVQFGPGFKRPSKKTLRKAKAEKGQRMFDAADLHAIIDAADGQLKAMIFLGINCGFGNEDVATLRTDALELGAGWITHPRPKTGTEHKCKLWPETIAALQDVLNATKAPMDEKDAPLVFITKYGRAWSNAGYGTAIGHEMEKLLKRLKLKRPGMNFYALRHTHHTIADGSRDSNACDYIMGHVDEKISGHYIERIDDERLEAVADFVRTWLFPPAPSKPLRIANEGDGAAAESA